MTEAQRNLLDRLDKLAEKNRRAYKLALDDFRRSFTLGPTVSGANGCPTP